MSGLIQCVPNFSEGRRPEVIDAIVNAIGSASDARLVDYSMDTDHNRSVVTFIGEPEDIRRSILAGARKAVELIDLNQHVGGHPRIGAIDVIPVVPLEGIDMAGAVELSRQIGEDIAGELKLPVYFYESSAAKPDRCNLAEIRRGGYEVLKVECVMDSRGPDLGPSELHPTAGATVVGARGPLIAYNINLATDDIHAARSIASKIRKLRDSGEGMEGVKAIAVCLKSRGIAQVSTNLTLPHKTGLWDVYSFVESEACALGVNILESELIGAMRLDALVEAAGKAMKFCNLSETRILEHWMRKC
ncbi:MAG: glutamate formimidoyltransferase [Armatimonadetes bacterium]|nr:glutamate formimidoyltransferase [Armatimonadota bacterium]